MLKGVYLWAKRLTSRYCNLYGFRLYDRRMTINRRRNCEGVFFLSGNAAERLSRFGLATRAGDSFLD
jgi:hypothetical protein